MAFATLAGFHKAGQHAHFPGATFRSLVVQASRCHNPPPRRSYCGRKQPLPSGSLKRKKRSSQGRNSKGQDPAWVNCLRR
eukprot:364637-Chlamydomonas_euryale.AAC.8